MDETMAVICPIDGTPLSEGQRQCPTCGEDLGLLLSLKHLPHQLYEEGVQLAKAGELSAAVESLTTAIRLVPDSVEPRVVLGKVYAQQSRYAEAVAAWREALAIDSSNPKAQAGIQAAEALQRTAQAASQRAQTLVRVFVAAGLVVTLFVGFSLNLGWQALTRGEPTPIQVVVSPPTVEPTPAVPLDRIRQALSADPLGTYRLEIHQVGNSVRLSGVVPSQSLKSLAEQRVKAVEGVTIVDSTELRVVLLPLVEAVQAALTADPIAASLGLTAEMIGEGSVVLRGTVPNAEVKRHVEAIVRAVPGMRFVDSGEVIIVPLPLAIQVRAALQADPDIVLLSIEVEQHNHSIRLKGIVPQPGLKVRIETLAKSVAGVELVDGSELKVEYEVKTGDSLWIIAQRVYGNPWRWREIYEANRDRIPNPRLIHPGIRLQVP